MEQLELRPKLWMPEDLAEYLNVPVGWIYKRTRKNGPEMIPHIKLGKYIRFDQESAEFRGWLASHIKSAESSEADGRYIRALTIDLPVNRVPAKEKADQVG